MFCNLARYLTSRWKPKTKPRYIFIVVLVAGVLGVAGVVGPSAQAKEAWLQLEQGLELGTFVSPQPSDVGDSRIRILRIDPAFFSFHLLNASAEPSARRQGAKEWATKHNLVATINASLYQADNKTSVSLMRTGNHVNNGHLSRDKTLLVFDSRNNSLPNVQIVDRDCLDINEILGHYASLVQSIRMISCKGENVWAQQSKRWSTAAIGMDGQGRILFIHVRSPYTTHDLIEILLQLPIGLKSAMYTEGGPVAQLYVHSGEREYEFLGSYSTGSNENDGNTIAWPIPNVVGIARITK